MKRIIIIIVILIMNLISCVPSSHQIYSEKKIQEIISEHYSSWTIEQCDYIIDSHTVSNYSQYPSHEMAIKLSSNSAFISAIPYTELIVKALTRKIAIQKRLSKQEFDEFLSSELLNFNGLILDDKGNTKKSDLPADLLSFSFLVNFENVNDPYRPIQLENGYSYFFLENDKGQFSRVKEVSGLFVEDHFILNDFLSAIITFNNFDDNGKILFNNGFNNFDYRLVFNGIQSSPIILDWSKK